MKKLLSVVLTLVMLLSLIPAAFAAGPTKDRNAKLTVTPGQIVLEPGVAEHGSAELVASIKGGTADAEGSSEVTYTFTCASEAVALQDGSAANKKTVLAVTAGTAKITVRADWTDKAGKEYYTEKTVPVTVREMTLKEESLTLGVGGTYQLTAEVAPKNSSLTWSSSNIKVASVSSNGLVNARSAGTATITVKCGNIEDSCEVTVLAVKKLTIDKTKLELAVGDTPVALVATVDPAEATVLWSSSDEKVATVDENGVVTPVAGGTATITAKCGNKSVTCKVTVVGIKKLSYNATMSLGSSQTITATVYPTSGYTVEWESNDENVVKFKSSSAGVKQTLLAMGTGTATITATMYKRSGGTKTAVATQNFDIEVTENIITYSTTTTFTFGNGSNSIYSQISNALSTLYGSGSGSGTTSLSGSITVYVTKNPAAAVNYSTQVNVSKVFSSTDFYNAITNTLGVSTTNWNVTFDRLPASTAGKLLSNFYSNTSYTEAVAGTYYNYSELNSFRFVPYTGYTGNVTIPFTVYVSGEKIFSSSVVIKVGSGATYNCTSEGAAMQLVTFYNSQDTDPVASVSFQQPSVGKLYYNYTGGSGTLVKSSDIYYTNASLVSSTYALPLTSVKYVPKANYSGSVTINYTATTRSGMTYSSTLTIQVSSKTQSARFADVDRTFNWAADSVDFMYNYGIVKGVDTAMTKFNPNGKMSRGDLVLILYRMAGSPSVSGVSNPFSDVNTTHYYYNAILWAYNKGVVSGVGGGKFAPDRAVTREQIATILYQYNTKILGNGNSGSASLNGYKDAGKVSSYATAAMQWAVGNGYVTGTTTTTLSPASTATRAQVAVMLHRLLTY